MNIFLIATVLYHVLNPCYDFDYLQTRIREGKIEKSEAKEEFKKLIPEIKTYFYDAGGVDAPRESWVFPVEGYNASSIGGNGNGYTTGGFDYFDGNKSKAHPAHDIFIKDDDFDDVDDKTGTLVHLRSMSSGVVISVVNDWQPDSELRGGKSVLIYDPMSNGLFAYAHASFIFVGVGDILKPGAVLGTVGRTGKNAAKLTSPTHLHISYMHIDADGLPRPQNIYKDLVASSKRK